MQGCWGTKKDTNCSVSESLYYSLRRPDLKMSLVLVLWAAQEHIPAIYVHGVLGENPHRQRENMHPHRKATVRIEPRTFTIFSVVHKSACRGQVIPNCHHESWRFSKTSKNDQTECLFKTYTFLHSYVWCILPLFGGKRTWIKPRTQYYVLCYVLAGHPIGHSLRHI